MAQPHTLNDLSAASTIPTTQIQLWDWPVRVFHWSLLAAVTTAIVTGKLGGAWMGWHGVAGQVILGLVVFRIVWGFLGSTYARFTTFVPTPARILAYLKGQRHGVGHNPLGALSVLALLGLLAVQATTGLFSNDDIAFTGPLAGFVDEALSLSLTAWHHRLVNVLFALLGLHVLAILFYVHVKKDNLVKPMVTGIKEVPITTPAPRKAGWLAFLTSTAIALGVVYGASAAWQQQAPAPAPPSTGINSGAPGW